LVGLSVLCSSLYFGTVAEEDVPGNGRLPFVKGQRGGQSSKKDETSFAN